MDRRFAWIPRLPPIKVVACCSFALITVVGNADIILSNSFDYPDGPIVGAANSPWQNHSGGGAGFEALVVANQLQLTFGRSEDIDAPLEGQPFTTGGGLKLYSSFTVDFTALPTGSGSYFAHFNAGSNHRGLVWASTSGAANGNLRLEIRNTTGATSSTGQLNTDLLLNTTYTVVTRYDVGTGLSTIWVNPTSESDSGATAADTPNPMSISYYSFRQATGMGTLFVDDLKVGSSFADVIGSTNEPPPPPPATTNTLTLVQYNVHGNGVEDWSTNSAQVRAIGRQLTYLNPDIITFNEIPLTNTWQLANWGNDFLSGYNIAANSGTDGFIRSAIASRHPIVRSTKWLDGADLKAFGYTNANPALDNFTRDLFEAEIAVPGFPQHLHVFTTHLKASTDSESAARRAAEASAISNFFVTVFLAGTNHLHPYILSGDMNEDIDRPPGTSQQPIQRLVSAPTGLHLTTPRNPFNNDERTWSIQSSLSVRYDYIIPCTLLFSNIADSQVFRTDLLNPTPSSLLKYDDRTASDHLPVVMTFSNPYDKPVQISSVSRSNENLSLSWDSVPGQPYSVEVSSNLTAWTVFATNLLATTNTLTLVTNSTDGTSFFRIYRVP